MVKRMIYKAIAIIAGIAMLFLVGIGTHKALKDTNQKRDTVERQHERCDMIAFEQFFWNCTQDADICAAQGRELFCKKK